MCTKERSGLCIVVTVWSVVDEWESDNVLRWEGDNGDALCECECVCECDGEVERGAVDIGSGSSSQGSYKHVDARAAVV